MTSLQSGEAGTKVHGWKGLRSRESREAERTPLCTMGRRDVCLFPVHTGLFARSICMQQQQDGYSSGLRRR